jgi:hypothetical protein
MSPACGRFVTPVGRRGSLGPRREQQIPAAKASRRGFGRPRVVSHREVARRTGTFASNAASGSRRGGVSAFRQPVGRFAALLLYRSR